MLAILLFLNIFADAEATNCLNASFVTIKNSETHCFAQDVAIVNTDTNKVDLKVSVGNDTTRLSLSTDDLYILKQFTRQVPTYLKLF